MLHPDIQFRIPLPCYKGIPIFSHKSDYSIMLQHTDSAGWIIIVDLYYSRSVITIISILHYSILYYSVLHAPDTDNIEFFITCSFNFKDTSAIITIVIKKERCTYRRQIALVLMKIRTNIEEQTIKQRKRLQ